jgi:hypothetical protein
MQQAVGRKQFRERLTYANVMSTVAAFLALGGATAIAASHLEKNSVGSRQLKAKAVTTGKLAPNAINGSKVADGSLTGADIKIDQLGTVPSATNASHADNANTVGGHSAVCPQGTTLVHGICFDATANQPAPTLKEAADDCGAKGGYLPTPMELYSARGVLSLGTGVGTDHQYTDEYYGNTNGGEYRTIVIDGTGAISEAEINAPSRYICAYPLVR